MFCGSEDLDELVGEKSFGFCGLMCYFFILYFFSYLNLDVLYFKFGIFGK